MGKTSPFWHERRRYPLAGSRDVEDMPGWHITVIETYMLTVVIHYFGAITEIIRLLDPRPGIVLSV